MKGIILAGGKATRLYPVTKAVCKQLLPVYDKPLIYYPLSTLMLSGIKDILVISTPKDTPRLKDLLGSGRQLGIKLTYAVQKEPNGLAQAFIIGKEFIGRDSVCLVLGDNIFYGHDLTDYLKEAFSLKEGAVVFGYYVGDPQNYGVIGFDKKEKVVAIKEKPNNPKSNWVVTGLYFYDNEIVKIAQKLKPSSRGELEITDVNNEYIKKGRLKVKLLQRGYAWFDTGNPNSLIDASVFIKTIEERQGLKIGCIEEVAYRMGYIDKKQMKRFISVINVNTDYAEYLKKICKNGQ